MNSPVDNPHDEEFQHDKRRLIAVHGRGPNSLQSGEKLLIGVRRWLKSNSSTRLFGFEVVPREPLSGKIVQRNKRRRQQTETSLYSLSIHSIREGRH